jgi:glycerol-3-phosphate dehydrogenase
MQSFSSQERTRSLEHVKQDGAFDLLVIGGGITGVAAARDAARRGLSVCLAERGDYACGTSSRSSKLVHGGLRYLETYDFALVHEGCQERRILLDRDPLHVEPLEFVYPVYKGDKAGYYQVKAGMLLYDALAAFRNIHLHTMLSPKGVSEKVPGVRTKGLTGGAVYYDARMDDARYTLATARAAARDGAKLMTYCEATDVRTEGKLQYVNLHDHIADCKVEVTARSVVIACGPWTDIVRARLLGKSAKVLRPTKGVHLVVPRHRMPLDRSMLMRHPDDGRVVFNIPWGDTATIIGTTDTDFKGDPSDAHATLADIDYILRVANFVVPGSALTREDVVASYTGLRPMMQEEGVDEGATSREHAVLEDGDGIFTIAGGKFTTHRRMAKDVVDRVIGSLKLDARPCSTATAPIEELGTPMVHHSDVEGVKDLAEREGLEPSCVMRLSRHFGRGMKEVLDLLRSDPSYKAPIVEGQPILLAEVPFWVKHEQTMTLTDGLDRRSSLSLVANGQAYEECPRVAREMGKLLNWSGEEEERQVQAYREHVGKSRAWRDEISTNP